MNKWTEATRFSRGGQGGAESNGVGSPRKEDGVMTKLSRQGLVCVAKTCKLVASGHGGLLKDFNKGIP